MSLEIDPGTLTVLALVYPELRVRAIRTIQDMNKCHGLVMKAHEGLRSFATAAENYAKGRTINGVTVPGPIITNAQPGYSWHNYGLGIDFIFSGADPYLEHNPQSAFLWEEFAKFGRMNGLVAGADFKHLPDRDHLEFHAGLLIQDARHLYQVGGIKAVWAQLDQIRGIPPGTDWDGVTAQALPDPGTLLA